jgi:hypothetical protein
LLLGKNQFILDQDKGDRREVFFTIDRLPKDVRILWIEWCCRQISNKMIATQYQGTGETADVFNDWQHLCYSLGLDPLVSLNHLETLARQFGRPKLFGV